MNSYQIELYRCMKRIRMFEDAIADDYPNRNMHTPIHLYTGQEAVAAGVCMNLQTADTVVSNHRCHGHYIAKGGDCRKLVAELYNKETGCSKGRGGSMHLMDEENNFMLSSSIVAGGVPLGTGIGLKNQITDQENIVVIFMGDAATEEGCVYESICFSALKKLPVLYVCENNQYSICTPLDKREPTNCISDKFKGILPVSVVDGNDVEEVYMTAKDVIARIRRGEGPSFIECNTYRLRDHHNTGTGVELGYRSQEEWDLWNAKSPILNYEEKLKSNNILNNRLTAEIEDVIKKEIEEAFLFAQESELPQGSDVMEYVYQEEI